MNDHSKLVGDLQKPRVRTVAADLSEHVKGVESHELPHDSEDQLLVLVSDVGPADVHQDQLHLLTCT